MSSSVIYIHTTIMLSRFTCALYTVYYIAPKMSNNYTVFLLPKKSSGAQIYIALLLLDLLLHV